MPSEQENAFGFSVSVLFQTVEELSIKVRAHRVVINSQPNAVVLLKSINGHTDPKKEARHQTYNELRRQAFDSLVARNPVKFDDIVRELRAEANRY